jgi:hypothetical protein
MVEMKIAYSYDVFKAISPVFSVDRVFEKLIKKLCRNAACDVQP